MPKSIPLRLAQRGSPIIYRTWLCIRVSRRPLLAEKLLRHHAPGRARPASGRAAARTLGGIAPCAPIRRAHSARSTTISGRSSSLCVPPGCCPGCRSGWWHCTTPHRRPTAGAAHADADMGGQVRHDRLCRDEMTLTPGARPGTERSLERRAVATQRCASGRRGGREHRRGLSQGHRLSVLILYVLCSSLNLLIEFPEA
jgi:hypothetical protein